MYNINMEFKIPVNTLTPQEIIRILNGLGARILGTYAEKSSHFGSGYRSVGSIIQMGTFFFTFNWDSNNCKVTLNPIEWKDTYVPSNTLPIAVLGSQTGDTALFKCKEDVAAWLKNMSSIEQLKLSVKSAEFTGPAVMFMSQI